jgi:hypothetical protein
MSGVVISLDGLLPHPEPAQSMANHLRPALEKFVSALYRDVLGREAARSETQDWVEQVLAGTSRNTVAMCLLNSEERRRHCVRQYYHRFLDRAPTAEGLAFWTDYLASGRSHVDLIAAILGSDEYYEALGSSHDAFVRSLFSRLYHRKPNAAEASSWLGLLSSGSATRHDLAVTFVTSLEFRESTVRRWYLEILHHEPDTEGLTYWVDQVAQGTSFEKCLAGLLSNNEYFSRALLVDGLPTARPVS